MKRLKRLMMERFLGHLSRLSRGDFFTTAQIALDIILFGASFIA